MNPVDEQMFGLPPAHGGCPNIHFLPPKPYWYLAGPMRGHKFHNFPAFAAAAMLLRAQGYEIVSPAERDLSQGFDPARTPEEQDFNIEGALAEDFELILKSQGIITLPGWAMSEGARAERLIAQMVGLTILNYDPETNAASHADGPTRVFTKVTHDAA